MSEQRLWYRLEDLRWPTDYLKSVTHPLLQILEIGDYCSLYMFPEKKSLMDFNLQSEQATLFYLSFQKHIEEYTKMQEENGREHIHAELIYESQS